MSKLGTILGIISVGKALTGTPMYKRFLSGIAVVICLTIVTGMVAGALLLAAFYGVYEAFLAYGLASTPAMLTTAGLAVLTLALLVVGTLSYLRELMHLPHLLNEAENPIVSKTVSIAQAFIDGVTGSPLQRQRWL